MKEIPLFLIERLKNQYGEELMKEIVKGFQKKTVTFRINNLKTTLAEIEKEEEIRLLDIYKEGKIYLQSLSSMLPVLFLDLEEGMSILDMAAAPGGKTTEIASIYQDKILITACEKNKIRADRLRYNIKKQGVRRATVLESDASKLDEYFSFDSILLDSPCSGSGTLQRENSNSYFKEELIKTTKKLQKVLLKKAVQILKPGSTMIYSTCSILEEENELQIEALLNEKLVEVVPLDFPNDIPLLPSKIFGTVVVKPTSLYEGFFIAKLRKR